MRHFSGEDDLIFFLLKYFFFHPAAGSENGLKNPALKYFFILLPCGSGVSGQHGGRGRALLLEGCIELENCNDAVM